MSIIKTFSEFELYLESKSGSMYEYGCLMLYVNFPNWERFIGQIDKNLLYEPENERYGVESEPHITILYGIHSNVDDEQVIALFSDIDKSSFNIQSKGIDCFYNKDYDVLKMNVESAELRKLNELASNLPHTSTYPDYKPHITIAYFKKGNANPFINENFNIKINTIDKIVYSKTNGEKIDIPLK